MQRLVDLLVLVRRLLEISNLGDINLPTTKIIV
jgi:hypothetical protein